MGSSSSNMKNIPNAEELMKETGLSAAHIVRLFDRFHFLDKDNRGRLRPDDFEAIQDLDLNPIRDRIIRAFFSPGQEAVDFASFVRVLALFRPTDRRARDGSSRKLRFVFQLYDQDGDGTISRAELQQVLQAMLGEEVTEEQLQSIVDRSIQEADLDDDDAISFDEFRKSLEKINIENKMSVSFLR